jgi:hypothetical protein
MNLFNPRTLPKNAVLADPSVDPATVVSDLKSLTLNGFDEMQVLLAVDFAQYNVAHVERRVDDRFDRAKLTGFDFSLHRVSPGPKLNRLSIFQARDMPRSPAHYNSFISTATGDSIRLILCLS